MVTAGVEIVSEIIEAFRLQFVSNFVSFFTFPDALLGSGSEDEEDDEPTHHIRGGGLGLSALVGLGSNPDSLGTLGSSDMSIQSANSDSKITQDDSDQVSFIRLCNSFFVTTKYVKRTHAI